MSCIMQSYWILNEDAKKVIIVLKQQQETGEVGRKAVEGNPDSFRTAS
jgi:hypothetical protein